MTTKITKMTKLKKTLYSIAALLLAAALYIAIPTAATAADTNIIYTGETDSFTFAPGSAYTPTDLFENFKNAMPGDRTEQTVTISNTSGDTIDVYMRAAAHHPADNPPTYDPDAALSRGKQAETTATMNDFLSQLSMNIYNGAKTADNLIYAASPDRTDSLQNNIYLGSIPHNTSRDLLIELSVPIDLGNQYANRIGEVDWVFVIEEHGSGGWDDGGEDDYINLTVKKAWADCSAKHTGESITAILLRDGKEFASTVLDAQNNWTYNWHTLESGFKWTVREQNIPAGYSAAYSTSPSGNVITITNSPNIDPGSGPDKDPDTPGSDTEKSPGGSNGPDSRHPQDGSGTPAVPDAPIFTSDLTVIKVWDDNNSASRPHSVTLQLYNGADAVETVTLTAANGWTYTWDSLPADGHWQVVEVDIPDGYTPIYSAADGVITITNTTTLIDTGTMNLPIAVLGGLGALALTSGFLLKRRNNDRPAK